MPIDKAIRHQVGDRVLWHPELPGNGLFRHDVVYIVDAIVEMMGRDYVRVREEGKDKPRVQPTKFHWRFIPAAPAIIGFKPGDVVMFDKDAPLNKDMWLWDLDVPYVIASGNQWVRLVGHPDIRFSAKRFKLVKPAEQPKPKELTLKNVKKGDKVYIVDCVENNGQSRCGWVEEMYQYLGDGKAYTVLQVGRECIDVQFPHGYCWSFLPECLSFYPDKKEPKDPKELPDLREVLTLAVKQKGQNTICSYGTMNADGHINRQINDVCHARLCNPVGRKDIVAAALILSGHIANGQQVKKDRLHKYKAWVKYVLNDSPWSVACLTKDVDEALEKGVLLNVDVHRNWCISAAVAIREAVEFPERLDTFWTVLEKGYSGNVAYLCALYLIPKEGGGYGTGQFGGGHQALSGQMPWGALKKFFVKGFAPNPAFQSFRKEQGGYRILAAPIEGHIQPGDIDGGLGWSPTAPKAKQLCTIFEANTPNNVEGAGFYRKVLVKEEGLFTLAKFIDNELKGVQ